MIHPRSYIHAVDRQLIWYMNINQEQLWNTAYEFPAVTDHYQLELVKQQEQQLLLLADSSDTVLLHHHPDLAFLDYLQSEGFELPEIHVLSENETLTDCLRPKSLLIPYLKTKEMTEQAAAWPNTCVFGADPTIVKQINNKFWLRRIMEENGFRTTTGYFCTTLEQLEHAYSSLRAAGFEKCVLKIPYGSSGKGLKIIEDEAFFQALAKYIARRKGRFELLLEGWHPIKRHMNAQLWIGSVEIELLAVTEQLIDASGVYRGTCFTPYYEEGVLEQYRVELMRLGHVIQAAGYEGICGVDSILGQDHFLYPALEVNARFTQVTYLLPLADGLRRNYPHVSSRLIGWQSNSASDFTAWYDRMVHQLQPNQDNGFRVYTFARYSPVGQSRTLYRMGLLCYGKDPAEVQRMLQRLDRGVF